MAYYSETCELTSRKYAAEQGKIIPNSSKTFQFFWLHSSVFALQKSLKNAKF